jgi:hypothetical protein
MFGVHILRLPVHGSSFGKLLALAQSICLLRYRYYNRPLIYFQINTISPIDLSPFRRLRLASLNFNDSFEYRDGAWHLVPLIHNLPQSLEKLEFLGSHASEADVIHLIAQLCPGIVDLRLVHCTMFNNPGCMWWNGHQAIGDHHYMRGHALPDVGGYAVRSFLYGPI